MSGDVEVHHAPEGHNRAEDSGFSPLAAGTLQPANDDNLEFAIPIASLATEQHASSRHFGDHWSELLHEGDPWRGPRSDYGNP